MGIVPTSTYTITARTSTTRTGAWLIPTGDVARCHVIDYRFSRFYTARHGPITEPSGDADGSHGPLERRHTLIRWLGTPRTTAVCAWQ